MSAHKRLQQHDPPPLLLVPELIQRAEMGYLRAIDEPCSDLSAQPSMAFLFVFEMLLRVGRDTRVPLYIGVVGGSHRARDSLHLHIGRCGLNCFMQMGFQEAVEQERGMGNGDIKVVDYGEMFISMSAPKSKKRSIPA